MDSLLEKLKVWRGRRAMLEGMELFRVLSNETLNEIAKIQPKTKEELLSIKGFKEKKFEKYGKELLDVIKGADASKVEGMGSLFSGGDSSEQAEKPMLKRTRRVSVQSEIRELKGETHSLAKEAEEKIFTVSDYLDLINIALGDFQAKVIGEVSSLDIRGNYLFFGLKDKNDGSTMSCFMWQSNYRLSGVQLAEGMEVVVYGHPNIYKAAGKISMQVEMIELVGEGALKKAYDELKKKLEREGVFSSEKKKPIPDFPEKIGLITSRTGAVIHDFLNNIGKFGYKIKFIDSRVEGQLAVKDLQSAIRSFRKEDIDVLIIVRGGGSLESLQAFNNEVLVREIADYPVPVICGIGHDKDVPLVSLAADLQVSTPTAVTKVLNKSWEAALAKTEIYRRDIFNRYGELISGKLNFVDRASHFIKQNFSNIFETFRKAEAHLKLNFEKLGFRIKSIRTVLANTLGIVTGHFAKNQSEISEKIKNFSKLLELNSPERNLKLGYGILRLNGKIIRSVKEVEIGSEIDIEVYNGNITGEIKSKKSKHG